jgi:FlaA1/EpsC-like NDP-sugar epimerase
MKSSVGNKRCWSIPGLSPRTAGWLRQHRRGIEALADMFAWTAALLIAAPVRYEFQLDVVDWSGTALLAVFAALAYLGVGLTLSLYSGRHPIGSHAEFRLLASITVVVGLLTAFAVPWSIRELGYQAPRSLGILAAPLALFFMTSLRSQWRTVNEGWRRPDPSRGRSVIVIGAGEAGQQIIRSMMLDPQSAYIPVAVIDDDKRLRNRLIERVPVVGTTADLPAVAERFSADLVLIAISYGRSERIRHIVELCEAAKLSVRILPRVAELVDGRVTINDIREVTIADLLQREQAELDNDTISHYLRGRRVLVTGAGGSIGSELCRQVHGFGPEALYMLDRDESALHGVQLSIDGQGQLSGDDLVLADIRDVAAVDAIFERLRPDVVFHAAALKHVPILERHVPEAVKTNVLGTRNVLRAALRYGVAQFVNISTDKAADPENVLGFSKRVAERLTAAADTRSDGEFISVRFGNVLGSRGSVLTAFQAQIEAGGPITVTHPDVTRYFMTIEEAVSLVIQAGALGRGGDVLVLDMGEPVRIADLAHQMISMAHRDLEVIYTGLRPGERLHERLFSATETDIERIHPQIWHTAVDPLDLLAVDDQAGCDERVAYDLLRAWVSAPAMSLERTA